MPKTVLIAGSSSGFGEALVDAFAAAGWNVTATARNLSKFPAHFEQMPNVLVQRLDVTDERSIRQALAASRDRFGGLDALINAAGYIQLGTLEELSIDDIRNLFETNFFGLLTVTKEVLPGFREQGFGHIVNFSSLAGVVGLPLVSSYSASKWAVEGFSEALARETAHLGVQVTIVEPGPFATGLGGSARRPVQQIDAYWDADSAAGRAWFDPTLGNLTASAQAIVSITGNPDAPVRLYVGHTLNDARRYAQERLDEWDRWEKITEATL